MSFLPFKEQEALHLESAVLAKAVQPFMPVWIAVQPRPVPVPSGEGSAGGGGASKTESGELEGGRDNAPPQTKMTLKGALAVFKQFRKAHPKRRFEIRLGAGAHKTGFQVDGTGPSSNRGPSVPGVVGGGHFRGLNLEGTGWDGLRITTPEVCAFYGQEGLASVVILGGVQTIGRNAFHGCSSLASVAFPDALQTIGERAFYGCSSLVSLAFPDALQTIGYCAFRECSSLASVAFPDALQTIGLFAFSRCSSLASVAVPASMSVGSTVFPSGCNIVLERKKERRAEAAKNSAAAKSRKRKRNTLH
jgi:hypothetical protein